MNTTTNTTAQEINTNKVCLYFLTAVAIVSSAELTCNFAIS